MKELVIYTSGGCGHCKTMKEKLKENNIKFIEKTKSKFNEDWNAIMQLTGLGNFPTVNIGDDYFVSGRDFQNPDQLIDYIENYLRLDDEFFIAGRDFQNPDQFIDYLKNSKILYTYDTKYSKEDKIIQAFKTLTWSLNQGFARMFSEINELKKQKDEHKSTD